MMIKKLLLVIELIWRTYEQAKQRQNIKVFKIHSDKIESAKDSQGEVEIVAPMDEHGNILPSLLKRVWFYSFSDL